MRGRPGITGGQTNGAKRGQECEKLRQRKERGRLENGLGKMAARLRNREEQRKSVHRKWRGRRSKKGTRQQESDGKARGRLDE